jgi:hypothetical protein
MIRQLNGLAISHNHTTVASGRFNPSPSGSLEGKPGDLAPFFPS